MRQSSRVLALLVAIAPSRAVGPSSWRLQQCALALRGGSLDPQSARHPTFPEPQLPPSNPYQTDFSPDIGQQYNQPRESFSTGDDPYAADALNEDPMHETVQARLDEWKRKQQEYAATAQVSPRDEQGRLKLLMSVSKGSRATMFIILLFRALFLYEIADQKHTGLKRLMLVTPVCLMLIGNLAGVVASFTSPSHSSKKRLKAILNFDKLVEALLIVHSFLRLTILPSKYTPREVYVASIFHSVFFIIQSQAFTKLSWDDKGPNPTEFTMSSNLQSDNGMRETAGQGEWSGPNMADWNQGLPPSQRSNDY